MTEMEYNQTIPKLIDDKVKERFFHVPAYTGTYSDRKVIEKIRQIDHERRIGGLSN